MALRIGSQGDILTTVDHRDEETARKWAVESASRRPWRPEFRAKFAEVLLRMSPRPRRILELGSGPGLLARRILADIEVQEYVLFDFSGPMMEMAREALGPRPDVTMHLGDFKEPGWEKKLQGPFDAIVSMQAVHEIRHKRHVPWLYACARTLLRSGGMLVVCDAEPTSRQDPLQHQLASTRKEQECAMGWAGFQQVECHLFSHQYYLISARSPSSDW